MQIQQFSSKYISELSCSELVSQKIYFHNNCISSYLYIFAGDECLLDSKTPGICKLFSDCQQAIDDLRNNNRFPQLCGYQGMQTIVCCPIKQQKTKRKPGEISKKSELFFYWGY